MNRTQKRTFKNAAGKIDYTMTNDYMFRAVLQENKKVLTGMLCSLLHLEHHKIESVVIVNPIQLGEAVNDKTFVLDVKVILNNSVIINIEMQVLHQSFWNDRSLLYLCSTFNNLEKGEGYTEVKPAYHIGILDFTPFSEYPEFYSTNKMMNVKNHYIYNDKFTLNVLDLTQIHLATEEDQAYGIDYWAKLFKAKTWEDLKMIAQENDIFEETGETIFKLNQNDSVRYMCEAREEGQRILRTYENMLATEKEAKEESQRILRTYENMIAAEKEAREEDQRTLRTYENMIAAEKEAREEDQRTLRTYENMIAAEKQKCTEKEELIAKLQAQLEEYQK